MAVKYQGLIAKLFEHKGQKSCTIANVLVNLKIL